MEGSNYGVVRFGKDETRKQTCAISATHEIFFLSESLSPSVYALLRADKGVIWQDWVNIFAMYCNILQYILV